MVLSVQTLTVLDEVICECQATCGLGTIRPSGTPHLSAEQRLRLLTELRDHVLLEVALASLVQLKD